MENNKNLIIDGKEIKKGQRYRIDIDMGRMHDFTDLKMPVEIVSGIKNGPTLFISSTIHGDEINGIEIVKRLLNILDVNKISGNLIAIPIVNIFGFNDHSRYLPDRRDLNRCFPGLKNGSLASQLAFRFMQEIVLKSDYGIDIHSGSFHRVNYPQIRTNISNEINFELAKAFNPPLIINANFRDGSLRNASNQANIPLILYEAGEVLRFDEASIDIGLRGILNVMRKINMLENDVDISCTTNHNEIFVAYSSSWIRATKSGIFNCKVKLGMMIKKNEILGSIANPFGDNPVIIKSNLDGMIVGLSMMPLVNKGDAIIHVASDSTKNINQKILVDDN